VLLFRFEVSLLFYLPSYLSSDFREIRWEGVDWIHLAHDRDQ
jgi:hypothetical protein